MRTAKQNKIITEFESIWRRSNIIIYIRKFYLKEIASKGWNWRLWNQEVTQMCSHIETQKEVHLIQKPDRENYIKKNDNSSPRGSASLSCSLKTTCVIMGRGAVRNADSGAPPQTSESESKGVGPRNLHFDKLQVILKHTEIWASPYWKQEGWNGHLLFWWAKGLPPLSSPSVVQMGSAALLVIPLCWRQLSCRKAPVSTWQSKPFPGFLNLKY